MKKQRNKKAGESSNGSKAQYSVIVVLAMLLMLLRFIPFLFPESRMWGFNQLIFLPEEFTIIYIAGCLAVMALLITPVRDWMVRLFEFMADFIFASSRKKYWLFPPLMVIIIFWVFRMQVNLLGDGYSLINNLGSELPVVFKWSEVGAIRAANFIFELFNLAGLNGAKYSYSIISVISGGISVLFFILISKELGEDNYSRLFLFLVLIFGGWILLFFGYVENYPILWPFMTGYIFFSIRYIKNKNRLYIPSLMLFCALLMHLQTLFFLPSYMIVLFSRGKGKRIYRKYRKLIWLLLSMIAAAAFILFYIRYNQLVEFRDYFLPLFKGRPATPDSAIFSRNHLIDILNHSILLAPLWPILIFAGRKRLLAIIRTKHGLFLLVLALGGYLFIAMVDPKLGMGLDWDLFALTGLAPVVLLSIAAAESLKYIKKIMPGLVILSLIFVFPYCSTNIRNQSAIDYYVWLIKLDMPKTRSNLIVLREYYKDIGQTARSDSLDTEIRKFFQHVFLSRKAVNLVSSGRIAEGMALADSIFRTDPYSAESYDLMGAVYYMRGNYKRAIEYYTKASNLRPYNTDAKISLAAAYRRSGMTVKALEYFRQAQRFWPEYPRVLEGLMLTFYDMGEYDSSFAYGQGLSNIDSLNKNVYLVMGVSAYRIGDRLEAENNLDRYLKMSPAQSPDRDLAEDLLGRLR